jgi:hypothetical protein
MENLDSYAKRFIAFIAQLRAEMRA